MDSLNMIPCVGPTGVTCGNSMIYLYSWRVE